MDRSVYSIFSASSLEDGYDVYIIIGASGGFSQEAHDMAVIRQVQAVIQPMTLYNMY